MRAALNILLSWLKTVNVVEQLSVDDSHSVHLKFTLLLCMCHFVIKNDRGVCVWFLPLRGRVFLQSSSISVCFFLMCQCDHLDLFCKCMCVARRSACSFEHVSSGRGTEAAHLANVCGSPAFWECGVVADGKQLSFCICVCVWTCLCVVWSKAEKEPRFTWEQMTGSGLASLSAKKKKRWKEPN